MACSCGGSSVKKEAQPVKRKYMYLGPNKGVTNNGTRRVIKRVIQK